MLPKKDINLYTVYMHSPAKKEKQKRTAALVSPIVGVILAMAAVNYGLYSTNVSLENEIEALKSDLSDGDTVGYSSVDAYDEATLLYSERITELISAKAKLASYPRADSGFLAVLNACMTENADIFSYNYDGANGLLTLECRSADVNEISQCAANLRTSGLFRTVDYGGYALSGDYTTSGSFAAKGISEDSYYTFSVECVLIEPQIDLADYGYQTVQNGGE